MHIYHIVYIINLLVLLVRSYLAILLAVSLFEQVFVEIKCSLSFEMIHESLFRVRNAQHFA